MNSLISLFELLSWPFTSGFQPLLRKPLLLYEIFYFLTTGVSNNALYYKRPSLESRELKLHSKQLVKKIILWNLITLIQFIWRFLKYTQPLGNTANDDTTCDVYIFNYSGGSNSDHSKTESIWKRDVSKFGFLMVRYSNGPDHSKSEHSKWLL